MHTHNNDRKIRKPLTKRKYFNQPSIDITIDRASMESIKSGYSFKTMVYYTRVLRPLVMHKSAYQSLIARVEQILLKT